MKTLQKELGDGCLEWRTFLYFSLQRKENMHGPFPPPASLRDIGLQTQHFIYYILECWLYVDHSLSSSFSHRRWAWWSLLLLWAPWMDSLLGYTLGYQGHLSWGLSLEKADPSMARYCSVVRPIIFMHFQTIQQNLFLKSIFILENDMKVVAARDNHWLIYRTMLRMWHAFLIHESPIKWVFITLMI